MDESTIKNSPPYKTLIMHINNCLALINDPDTSKLHRKNAKDFALLILGLLLRESLPIPRNLAIFCAEYIQTLIKKDGRGAKRKHNQVELFHLYRFLTEKKGMPHSEAINELVEFHDYEGIILDPTTISKSVAESKKLLDLIMKANGIEK